MMASSGSQPKAMPTTRRTRPGAACRQDGLCRALFCALRGLPRCLALQAVHTCRFGSRALRLMVAGGLFLIWGKKGGREGGGRGKRPRHTPAMASPEHATEAPPRVAARKGIRTCRRVTASLLALSHIYTASSKGGDVATIADEPVATQQASTGDEPAVRAGPAGPRPRYGREPGSRR